MKAVMIIYNQAHASTVVEILDALSIRGFTRWTDIQGRGSYRGEPHYGTHAWPSKNMAILAMIEEERLPALIDKLKSSDESAPEQGLRAFVWEADSIV